MGERRRVEDVGPRARGLGRVVGSGGVMGRGFFWNVMGRVNEAEEIGTMWNGARVASKNGRARGAGGG
jgi:hypothetical protein